MDIAERLLEARNKSAFQGDKARIELQLAFEKFKSLPDIRKLSPIDQMMEFLFAQSAASNAKLNILCETVDNLIKTIRNVGKENVYE